MSINNSRDFLKQMAQDYGYSITDHLLRGRNIQLAPETYVPDWDNYVVDSVTFRGTAANDVLFGGGGEAFTFFLGTPGNDLYGSAVLTEAYVDYSGAKSGVFVDMSYRGSRTFTDANGDVQTVAVIGRARDGFGGTDFFAESGDPVLEGYSSIFGILGTSHNDVMIGGGGVVVFYGGRGNDLLVGGWSYGGAGNDRLIGRADDDYQSAAFGDEGRDVLQGTDFVDTYLVGGAGDDFIFARGGNDRYVTGNEGNDFIDGGAGDDFIDGGVGRDVLLSGAGNDIINPDVEFFQRDSSQPRDGARDVILVTRADLGAFTDQVLFNAFEEDRDQIRFGDAVKGGLDFQVYQEDIATLPGKVNTILQIDHDRDGFDADDYYLIVAGADLSLQDGYLLT